MIWLVEKTDVEDKMSTTEKFHPRRRMAHALYIYFVLSHLLVLRVAYCQAQQNPPETPAYGADRANLPAALAKVKSGKFLAVHVDLIARAGAVEAIPSLKQQFVRVQDPLLKAKIAAALLRLGDKD